MLTTLHCDGEQERQYKPSAVHFDWTLRCEDRYSNRYPAYETTFIGAGRSKVAAPARRSIILNFVPNSSAIVIGHTSVLLTSTRQNGN